MPFFCRFPLYIHFINVCCNHIINKAWDDNSFTANGVFWLCQISADPNRSTRSPAAATCPWGHSLVHHREDPLPRLLGRAHARSCHPTPASTTPAFPGAHRHSPQAQVPTPVCSKETRTPLPHSGMRWTCQSHSATPHPPWSVCQPTTRGWACIPMLTWDLLAPVPSKVLSCLSHHPGPQSSLAFRLQEC